MEIRKSLTAIILAAGKGSRMNSGGLSKVLHEVNGMTMLDRVLQTLTQIKLEHYCLVLGKNWTEFTSITEKYKDLAICIQKELNGTAGAVASCAPFFKNINPIAYASHTLQKGRPVEGQSYVLICYGDTPMIKASVIEEFVLHSLKKNCDMCGLGMNIPEPKGYGRLILDENKKLSRIVEEKDATTKEKEVSLCNSGMLIARTEKLFKYLEQVESKNAQGEYYLTDTIALARKETEVEVFTTDDWQSFLGINTKEQLQNLQKKFKNIGY